MAHTKNNNYIGRAAVEELRDQRDYVLQMQLQGAREKADAYAMKLFDLVKDLPLYTSIIEALPDANSKYLPALIEVVDAIEHAIKCGCITCSGDMRNLRESIGNDKYSRDNMKYFIQWIVADAKSTVLKHNI